MSTCSVPPGRCTRTGLAHQPCVTAAAAAAAPLDPDAEGSPTPRSQTSTVRSLSPSGRRSWTSGRPTSAGPRSTSTSAPSTRAGIVRSPSRTRGNATPLRRASQSAAMRAPLPESSAVVPSRFQTTTSASGPRTSTISSTPSAPTPVCMSHSCRASSPESGSGSSARSKRTYVLPSACHFENRIRHLFGRPLRVDHDDARDPAHPLALVRRVATGARDDRALRFVRPELEHILQAERLRGRRRRRLCTSGFLDDAALEHLVRAALDSLCEHIVGDLEPGDECRPARLLGPQPVCARRERGSRLRQLERTYHTPAIVRVHERGRCGVALAKLCEGCFRIVVVCGVPPLAHVRIDARRELQLSERGPQVEAGPACDDGGPAGCHELVDGRLRE